MEPQPATYVSVKQGGRVLLDKHQFKYIKNKTNAINTKCYYVCSEKRTLQCKATATVDIKCEPNMIVDLKNEHCHDNSLVASKVREIEAAAIKSVATYNTVSLLTTMKMLT